MRPVERSAFGPMLQRQQQREHPTTRPGDNRCATTHPAKNRYAITRTSLLIDLLGYPRGSSDDHAWRGHLPDPQQLPTARIAAGIATGRVRPSVHVLEDRFVESEVRLGA